MTHSFRSIALRGATPCAFAALGALLLALALTLTAPGGAWAGEALDEGSPQASSITLEEAGDGISTQTGITMVSALDIDFTYNYRYAFDVLNMVNNERAANGLDPLVMDQRLLDAAMKVRAPECAVFYSHTRPNGEECFTAALGLMHGENIAFGYGTPAEVMDGWMNSPGHRANILRAEFTTIGVGCVNVGSRPYWVQCFGTAQGVSEARNPGNTTAAARVAIPSIWLVPDNFAFEYTGYSVAQKGTTQLRTAFWNQGGKGAGYAMLRPNTFTWSSAKTSVATVNSSGVVTGKAPGTTSVSAKIGNSLTISVPVQVKGETGTWKKTGGKWWFSLSSGGYPRNAWCQIEGDWYFFDKAGYMKTGWLQSGKSWYYLKNSGVMSIGWQKVGSKWYYFNGSGVMQTGWKKISGSWYYLESSGAMATGRWVGNSYVYTSGVMATNTWIGKYHVNANGIWDKTR